jgi:hypothetical protein
MSYPTIDDDHLFKSCTKGYAEIHKIDRKIRKIIAVVLCGMCARHAAWVGNWLWLVGFEGAADQRRVA